MCGAFHSGKIILSQPPVLWMGIIMFCPKHLRFSCPDLPPKWVQLMTITLQVSQHRHVLIGTYLEGARACPPSKYVMITAVTQWGGGGHNCYSAIYLCLPQLSTTLTSPDKPEWIDLDFPVGQRGVDWRCWNSWSDEDQGRCGLAIVSEPDLCAGDQTSFVRIGAFQLKRSHSRSCFHSFWPPFLLVITTCTHQINCWDLGIQKYY